MQTESYLEDRELTGGSLAPTILWRHIKLTSLGTGQMLHYKCPGYTSVQDQY